MLIRAIPAIFVLLWSTGFIGSKLGAPYAEPFTFLTLRFAIVVMLLVPFCFAIRAPWPRGRLWLHAIIVGMLIHGLYLGSVFWSIDEGMSAGASALIVSLQPVLTALLAAPLLGERISGRHWLGLALGLIGAAMVLMPRLGSDSSGVTVATVGACVIGLVGITVGSIYQKRFAQGIDLRTGAVAQYIGALIVVGSASVILESRQISWSGEFAFALVWLIFVLSIGAISLLMYLIREGAISQVASYFYLVPAVTALIAWWLFDEQLSLLQFAGMALAGLAVILVSRPIARGGTGATGTGTGSDGPNPAGPNLAGPDSDQRDHSASEGAEPATATLPGRTRADAV